MSKLRNLIEATPRLGQCIDADRFTERNTGVFDKEINEPESVYAHRESDGEGDRLAVLEIPTQYIGNSHGYDRAMNRVRISMLSQDKAKGRITERGQLHLDALISLVESNLEVSDPSEMAVEEILPLEVSTMGVWD